MADRLGRENDNLRRMIADLADQKNKLERLYMHKSESDAGKAEQIRRMHEDNDKKTQALLREGRREMQREIEARRKTEDQCKRLEAEVRVGDDDNVVGGGIGHRGRGRGRGRGSVSVAVGGGGGG